MPYVVARTASKRPSLQHFTVDHEVTSCGLDISIWSRAYMKTEIKEIFCLKCRKSLAR
ncbi:hypothetical protein SEA_HUWBERT_74 [Microbacterium phage Huwbert]|nr:hypothetical protein SEA_HUWBERT_74 [Microbacterium phage Huwbert]